MTEHTRMSEVVRATPGHKPETPEGVALELMEMIFFNELSKPTREDILSTYSDCLSAAKGTYQKTPKADSGADASHPETHKVHSIRPMQDELAESRIGSVESLDHQAV